MQTTVWGRSIEIRGAASVAEVDAAMTVFDSTLGSKRGWQLDRPRHRELYRATPEQLSVAVDGLQIVGGVGCDGMDGIGAVAVLEEWRGQGLGRRLLDRAENVLRERGGTVAGLGSYDGAADFYLSCGYEPQLLVQFAPEVDHPEVIVEELLAGVLAGREVFRRQWQKSPQLWLQERSIDWDLKRRIEAVAAGVAAQYVMSKQL